MENNNPVTRQQKWEEIRAGKRKLNWLFPKANEALLAGICSFIGVLGLGIVFGIWGIWAARKSLLDQNENTVKSFRTKAWVAIVLSACGILFSILINLKK